MKRKSNNMGVLKTLCNWLCKKYFSNCNDPECEEELEKCKQDLATCQQNYQQLLQKYNEDRTYYESRIQSLLQMLANSIQIPKIELRESPIEITWQQIANTIKQKLGNVVFDFADVSYWTFSKEQIESILKVINEQIKAQWTAEVYDCDDFALTLAGLTAYTCYKNGWKKQLALGIAWSAVHAFNFFIDKNLEIWVWEPQSARTVGKATDLKNTLEYGIQQIWLMG